MPIPIAGLIPVVSELDHLKGLTSDRSVPPPAPAGAQGPSTDFDIILRKESTRSEQRPRPSEAPKNGGDGSFQLWEKKEFGLGDILDILNPLQHLPLVSTIYRSLSGDPIGPLPRLVGGALYGRLSGIPGIVSSVVNSVIGIATGKDIGEHLFALLFGAPNGSGGQGVVPAKAPSSAAPVAGPGGATPQAALAPPGKAEQGAAHRAGIEELVELLRQARLSGPHWAFDERAHALRSYRRIAALHREKPGKADFLR